MSKEEWKCCDCPKSRAHKHDELWSFTQYGNNPKMKEDHLLGNQRCEDHFKKKTEELSKK